MSMLAEKTKKAINTFLGAAGLELRRTAPKSSPPPLYDEPVEAISRIRSGERAAILARIDRCVTFNGFSLAPNGWHPFVDALRETITTGQSDYLGSRLERFYATWQPANAQEALLGASSGPNWLASYPPLLMHAPWLEATPDEQLASIRRIIELENASFGLMDTKHDGGHGLLGPTSVAKGELEYRRLLNVFRSIESHGYDRNHGDITGQVLVRNGDYRFRIVHGQHRVAAVAALGYEHIALHPKRLVDRKYCQHWPQVYAGRWSADEAAAFFDHLFCFDSLEWAGRQSLGPDV